MLPSWSSSVTVPARGSADVGNLIMSKLYSLDEVAYVRFASVYRRFKDVSYFQKELKKFLE